MRNVLLALGVLSFGGLIYGLTDGLHRSADTVAMLRPVLAGIVLVAAVLSRRRGVRVVFGLSGVLALFSVGVFLVPQERGGALRLYSKNLNVQNDQIEAIAADILNADVDVALLQEVSVTTVPLMAMLAPQFPHQHICDANGKPTVALASRHPIEGTPQCTQTRALAAARILKDARPVWIVSTHIPWPWPFDNAIAEAETEALLDTLEGAIIMAGDFNIFPWSGRFARIRRITHTRAAGPTRPTLTYNHVPLPLDHVLAPGGGAITLRPLLGSDHHGLVADVAF